MGFLGVGRALWLRVRAFLCAVNCDSHSFRQGNKLILKRSFDGFTWHQIQSQNGFLAALAGLSHSTILAQFSTSQTKEVPWL